MEIQSAIAKIDKYSSTDSGDTVEIIERPNGGISIVLADGTLNNIGTKAISMFVAHQIITYISKGLHDGASTRSTLNDLENHYGKNASVSLIILTIDQLTKTLVITHKSQSPIVLVKNSEVNCLQPDNSAQSNKDPAVYQIPLEGEMSLVVFTDGVLNAGKQYQNYFDPCTSLSSLFSEQEPSAQEIATNILSEAIKLDQNKPEDDMSVVVLRTDLQTYNSETRVSVKFPLKSF